MLAIHKNKVFSQNWLCEYVKNYNVEPTCLTLQFGGFHKK